MAKHNELGEKGERIAREFLIKKEYEILDTNYRFKHLELDIICKKNDLLIVVEVKTRTSSFLVGPHETVTKSKQKSLIKITNQYIIEKEIDMEVQFDIISIILNQKECLIEHIEDAFYPTL